MNIKVTTENVNIVDEELNQGEYNIRECNFDLSEEYNGLVCKALFTVLKTKLTYEQAIENGTCQIPYEATVYKGNVVIGVIGYEIENEELVKRYSPNPDEFYVTDGSYVEDIENQSTPTPTQLEQLEQLVENNETSIRELEGTTTAQGEIIQSNTENIQQNTGDIADIKAEQLIQNNNILLRALITETGSQIVLNLNTSDYKLTAILKDKNGTTINTSNAIDLPIESMIINASYDSSTKEIILTLQNGNTIKVSIADLINGLQSEITPSNKLSSDLVDDTNKTHKFVTEAEKTKLAGIEAGAEVNVLEGIKINGTAQTITNKAVNIVIDNELSDSSENAIQNKTVKSAIDELESENADLEERLSQVETQFEPVNVTGTSIMLSDGSDMRFKQFKVKGNFIQGDNPTLTSPQEITILGSNEDLNINIKNKQLFNSNADYLKTRGTLTIDGTTITFTGNNSSSVSNMCWVIPIEPLKQVIITASSVTKGSGNNNYVRYAFSSTIPSECPTGSATTSITAALTEGVAKVTPTDASYKYLILQLRASTTPAANAYITVKDLMVRQYGNENYLSYQKQTYTMPVQEDMLDEDYFDLENEKEIHNWKLITLDGTEEITKVDNTSAPLGFSFRLSLPSTAKYMDNVTKVLRTSHFTIIANNITILQEGCMSMGSAGTFVYFVLDSSITTEEGAQQYFASQYQASTPVQIAYALQTPRELAFTTAQKTTAIQLEKARTYKDITYINSSNIISPIFDVTYYKDNLIIDGFLLNNNSVPIEKMENFEQAISLNVFNINDEDNVSGQVKTSDGTVTESPSSDYMTTHYMHIEPNTQYRTTSTGNKCFYDIDKNFISSQAYNAGNPLTTPADAYYCRMSVLKTNYDDFMFVKGTTIPNEYIPYEYYKTITDLYIPIEHIANLPAIDRKYSVLRGKKIGFLGDSYTNAGNNGNYPERIAERTQMQVYNYGVSGSRIVGIGSYTSGGTTVAVDSFITRCDDMEDNLDMVLVFGGINDSEAASSVLGTINDAPADNSTFYAGYKYLVEKLFAKYPTAKIGVVVPPQIPNYTNLHTTYKQAIIDVANLYAIPYIDLDSNFSYSSVNASLYNLSRFSENNANSTTPSIHLNLAGKLKESYLIERFLEQQFVYERTD